uniref:TerD domain-containing protein n=1 Tax=Eutreptiella gymnastica TaxID=73025 RepID=A0A6U7X933_9EUGL|mmetsp:Transcript_137342/g.238870  ORF Transcript_137342/g.238870 Transcript_137342/m.238870 type:complete len:342 (+) Transcript_137342:146-1171(+)
MADEEEINEETEIKEVKRVRKVTQVAQYEEVLQDHEHEKLVCVAWLVEGEENSKQALPWLEEVDTSPALADVILLHCNPNEVPDLATQQELHAIPTIQYFWKGEKLFTFVGTNKLKFKAYLDKALKTRFDEMSIPKAWQRKAAPLRQMLKGDKYDLSEAALEGPLSLTLAIGWDMPTQDPPVQLETAVLLLADGGKALSEQMVIKSDRPKSLCSGVEMVDAKPLCDDDVCVQLALDELDLEVWEVFVFLYIVDAKEKEQSMSAVGDVLYVRLYDRTTNQVILKYDLEEDTFGENTGVLLCKMTREEDTWGFSTASEVWEVDYEELKDKFVQKEKKKKTAKK